MVNASIFQGKAKVLTSIRAKETRTVDPKRQISTEEFKNRQNSRYERGEASRAGIAKPRVTSRILLNKCQR